MLDRSQSDSGCAINLAVHFLDLFGQLTGQPITAVRAMMTGRAQGVGVEDHSGPLVTAADGAVGVIETGYCFLGGSPEPREFGLLATSMVRSVPLLVHTYVMLRQIRLLNSTIAIIVISAARLAPQTVWFMKNFINSVPADIEEAANGTPEAAYDEVVKNYNAALANSR